MSGEIELNKVDTTLLNNNLKGKNNDFRGKTQTSNCEIEFCSYFATELLCELDQLA